MDVGRWMLVAELKNFLTFRVENLPDYRRVALQTFRIAIGFLSYFKTFGVALLPRYPSFCNSCWLFVADGLKLLFLTLIRLRLHQALFEAILCQIMFVGCWVSRLIRLQQTKLQFIFLFTFIKV